MSLFKYEVFFALYMLAMFGLVFWFLWDERKENRQFNKDEKRKLKEINNNIVKLRAEIKDNIWDACNLSTNFILREMKKKK